MRIRHRLLVGSVLAVGLSLCCCLLGAFVAARCCVPAGSGLAGPGSVVGSGLMAGGIGLLAGGLLASMLSPRALRKVATAAGLGGGLVLVLLVIAVLRARSETRAQLESAYARLPPFTLELSVPAGAAGAPFERLVVDWGTREATLVMHGETCRVPLAGREAAAWLGAVRGAEGVMYAHPDPCPHAVGPPLYHLRFVVTEALPPPTHGDAAPDAACVRQWPALDAPMAEAKRQLGDLRRRCSQPR